MRFIFLEKYNRFVNISKDIPWFTEIENKVSTNSIYVNLLIFANVPKCINTFIFTC